MFPRLSIVALGITLGCRPQVDLAREREALLETDRAWAVAAASGSADSVVAFWTEDANVAMAGAPLASGKPAIREMVMGSFAVPGFRISWTPERAVVAASGDLGYTTGTNEVSMPDSTGQVTRMPGRYLAVWRRDSDGQWRNVEDYATPAPAPSANATPQP